MSMMKDHEKATETIENQYQTLQENKEEMEKLRLEVTVILTEKGQLQQESRRINQLLAKLQRDSKE